MEIVLRSFFGEGSGVSEDLIGNEKSCLVVGEDEKLLLIGEILSQIAQGSDIRVTFFEQ